MPHKTTWEKEGINYQFYGDVSPEEVEEANSEAYGDHRFIDIKYFIWDMTGVKNLGMNEEEDAVRSAVTDKGASLYKQSLKGALVANNKYIRKILERYIATSLRLESTWKLKLFYNAEDARKWITS